jgi:pimeloyl-ACP methyl ester carboxylesterase
MPLRTERVCRDLSDGLVEERFQVESVHGARVPGVVVYAADSPAPRPALLIAHGLNSGKDDNRLVMLRHAWARHGFACVSIDAPFHGERATGDPLDVPALLSMPYTGLHFVQQSVIDQRRALDYLEERGDIALDRIAYVGFSMGTFLGVQFVAIEPRIRAACFAMGGAGLFHFLVSRAPGGSGPDHELVANLIDPLHYAPCIAPRPVLQVNGTQDSTVPAMLAHMLHGALAEPKRMIWYPGGHNGIPEPTIDDMLHFLERHLGVVTPRT